jgi:serine protease AprX
VNTENGRKQRAERSLQVWVQSRPKNNGGGRRLLHLLLALALLVLLVPGGVSAAGSPAVQRAPGQPALQQSQGRVRVLAQYLGSAEEMSALVSRLDGEAVQHLSIIHAFAVELPASALPELEKSGKVRWVILDAPLQGASTPGKTKTVAQENTYPDTLGVQDVWRMGFDGNGITVAIIDSGIASGRDFNGTGGPPAGDDTSQGNRILKRIAMDGTMDVTDSSGHGTHVAGIVGGNGEHSDGAYAGVAPGVNFVSLNISNSDGMAYESDVVAAMQWVLENKDTYNIRVVNLSINSTAEMSYHESPLDAAAEILWFNGIVVVVSAGNRTAGGSYNTVRAAPANDPFLITVGASNEAGTADVGDDTIAPFSAFGTTLDGVAKPDLIAPGTDIFSVLAPYSDWVQLHPERVDGSGKYFRASGTSMAAPMVTGAVALLLQSEPGLTPDQVKYRLLHTGNTIQGEGFDPDGMPIGYTYPYLSVRQAVAGTTSEPANTGTPISRLLFTGSDPVNWNSVSWNSVSWNSVSWNSVSWNSVSWNSVSWNSVSWSSVNWNGAAFCLDSRPGAPMVSLNSFSPMR